MNTDFIAALYSKLLKRGETHVINTFQYMYLSLSFLALVKKNILLVKVKAKIKPLNVGI